MLNCYGNCFWNQYEFFFSKAIKKSQNEMLAGSWKWTSFLPLGKYIISSRSWGGGSIIPTTSKEFLFCFCLFVFCLFSLFFWLGHVLQVEIKGMWISSKCWEHVWTYWNVLYHCIKTYIRKLYFTSMWNHFIIFPMVQWNFVYKYVWCIVYI